MQLLCQKIILKALFLEKLRKKAKEVKAKMPDFLKNAQIQSTKPNLEGKSRGMGTM
jgi:hypothetical protein